MTEAEKKENGSASHSTYKLLFPSIAGLALMLLVLFLAYQLPCPSNSQYTIFRMILSAALAGFAVVLSGFFNFHYKQLITAGGALAVFAFTYIYTPKLINTADKCNEPFDYTVFLQDSTGTIPVKGTGSLAIRINNDLRRLPLDNEGSVNFKQIPSALKDSTIPIQVELDGWQFQNKKRTTNLKLEGKSSTLIIERDNSLCCIRGSIRDLDSFLTDVKVRINDVVTRTSENGTFTLTIPPPQQREQYKLAAEKKGYKTLEVTVFPTTGQDVELVLERTGRR